MVDAHRRVLCWRRRCHLAPDGTEQTVPSHWLANRSFLGVDNQGRVIFGTTQSSFFSLDALAD
jgi:hypothetical protein